LVGLGEHRLDGLRGQLGRPVEQGGHRAGPEDGAVEAPGVTSRKAHRAGTDRDAENCSHDADYNGSVTVCTPEAGGARTAECLGTAAEDMRCGLSHVRCRWRNPCCTVGFAIAGTILRASRSPPVSEEVR